MDPASEVHRALGWEVVQKYMRKYEKGIWSLALLNGKEQKQG